jgi:hypothetical protein
MAIDCARLSDFLFRRTPDWDTELAKDRFPLDSTYLGLYEAQTWDSFTGTVHTWDRVHVAMDNDDGCWDQMDADSYSVADCVKQDLCGPTRLEIGWGSTRSTYGKYHRDYTTKPFCMDRLRHIEEAKQQLGAIVEGLRELPDQIQSNFQKLLALRQSDVIQICSAANSFPTVTVATSIFTNNCSRIALGSTTKVPTSKLSMQYLNHFAPTLMYKGYFNKKFLSGKEGLTPANKFLCMTDIQTQQELTNANPALTGMYRSADFTKGGQYFAYGVMNGCGDWMFKTDPQPMRFLHTGGGVLVRVRPYQNVAATVGKKPQFDPLYEQATIQLSHIYCRAARKVYTGDITSVHPDMPFAARSLNGKWSWKQPDAFQYRDPETNSLCTYYNDKKNRGYFMGEFETGMKTIYPETEMWVLHLREAQAVADVPLAVVFNNPAPNSDGTYQTLTPYNSGCDTTEEV